MRRINSAIIYFLFVMAVMALIWARGAYGQSGHTAVWAITNTSCTTTTPCTAQVVRVALPGNSTCPAAGDAAYINVTLTRQARCAGSSSRQRDSIRHPLGLHRQRTFADQRIYLLRLLYCHFRRCGERTICHLSRDVVSGPTCSTITNNGDIEMMQRGDKLAIYAFALIILAGVIAWVIMISFTN